ncbi:MAG: penicillin-binding protein 1C [Acidobacteria bacterium]|nr:penicillin-binding protein 1C [Acidobacteriota bacterium]
MKKLKKSRYRRLILFFAAVPAVFFTAIWLTPLPKPLFPNRYSTVVTDRNGKIMRVFLNPEQQWILPPRPETPIPKKVEEALLTAEDRWFYHHPGVNPFAVVRAAWQDIRAGRIVSGASTLTMQLARISRPKARTIANKLLEMLQALKIEQHYNKKTILRMYLNHAPFGGNVIGIRAAAWKTFGTTPEKLTWSQAATLAVLPNAPGLISPRNRHKLLKEKRDRLLHKLFRRQLIDAVTLRDALAEPIPSKSHPFPVMAPHLCRQLHTRFPGKTIFTTIEPDIQQNAQTLTATYLNYLKHEGIRNGAVLVAETQSGKIRAYIGSQGFFDSSASGQVDGVQAPRSTGSILKPFLYALSMDRGLILPDTVMLDIPSHYGSFTPANADHSYAGLVTAREALTQSLNIPAVRLLNAYGVRDFYTFLKQAGMTTLFRSPESYGLPLILGGAEAKLIDLATLYRGLGCYGKFSPLTVVKQPAPTARRKEKTLISPGACFLTLNILRNLKRPGAEYYWELFRDQRPVAWKTGTSYGQRDAWAVGVSPNWTVAVWIGNFNGIGNPKIGGAMTAGPLLFNIFNTLPKGNAPSWFRRPLHSLKKIAVCKDTGYAVGPACPKSKIVEAPVNSHFYKTCPWHRIITVTNDEKWSVCSLCWKPGNHKQVSRLCYPPEVIQLLRKRGININRIPPHNPNCPGLESINPISINYPGAGTKIFLPRDFGGNYQKVLCRVSHRQADATIFWYLDDRYLGLTRKIHEMPVRTNPGWHTLYVVDENGNHASVRFHLVRIKKEKRK